MPFLIFIAFVALQRIAELAVARRNEKWIRRQGAVEYGKEHYPFIVALHALFMLSMILEFYLKKPPFDAPFLFVFFSLILLKIWVISSLGKFWNTKILRLNKAPLINNGPYKYIKHPNYMIVVAEIIVIPLVFHLYYTAVIFTVLNAIMLTVRIRVENEALGTGQ